MSKNTLYITFDGLSDPLGQSQILPYLSGISDNGFKITVISCEKKDRLNKEKSRIENILEKKSISWEHILYDEDGGFMSRISYVKKLFQMAETAHAEKKFTLVHCRSYLAALVGLKLKKKYNVPFLFDMRGFWANERIEGNIWNKKNPVHLLAYRYFKYKEKQFLKHSDAIISLTHAAAYFLSREFDDSVKTKISVIPCCVNVDIFDPEKISSPKEDHLLIYTGSIGTWYYTKEMIDCVLVMRSLIPEIRLMIVTRDTDALQQILETYKDEERKIISVKSASYSEMPSILAKAKASIFFIKPSFSKMASSPTKMAECWAMDLPIITNKGIGDNDLYFEKHQGGVLVNNFTKDAYLKAAAEYLKISAKPISFRKIATEFFNTKKAIEIYSSVYSKVSDYKL